MTSGKLIHCEYSFLLQRGISEFLLAGKNISGDCINLFCKNWLIGPIKNSSFSYTDGLFTTYIIEQYLSYQYILT